MIFWIEIVDIDLFDSVLDFKVLFIEIGYLKIIVS